METFGQLLPQHALAEDFSARTGLKPLVNLAYGEEWDKLGLNW